MKECMKRYKGSLILSSLVILLPIPVSLLYWDSLWLSPLGILAVHWFCILFVFQDRKNREQHPKAIQLALWACPVMSLLFGTSRELIRHGATTGSVSVLMALMFWGFGLLFVLMGNYLPKVRPNRTIGIKVKWALENEENWNATHRFAGRIWVICGLLCMACGLFPDAPAATILFVVLVLAAALIPCAYSYRYYKAQLQDGRAVPTKIRWKIVLPIAALTVGFLAYVLFSGSMEIVYGDTSFTVETGSWGDLTVNYADIQDIHYYDQDPSDSFSGMRTNGFGNLRMALGTFQNDLYGSYTRYTYVQCDACVVLTVDGETVVINGPDPEATRAIYQQLLEHV